MDKQTIADKLEKSILDRVRGLLVLLPNYISTENEGMFVTVCERVSKITIDAFTEAEFLGCVDYLSGWRRSFAPQRKNGYGRWEHAYDTGLTWKQFLDYILDLSCTDVEVNKNIDMPRLSFSDKNGVQQFCIELGIED